MTSRRELVLDAATAMIQAALPNAKVMRNRKKPVKADPGGTVIVRDGDIIEVEDVLSPSCRTYTHRIDVEVFGFESSDLTRSQVLDSLLSPIGKAIEADRTLGGLTEWLEPEPPEFGEFDAAGTDVLARSEFGLVCQYTVPNILT